MHRTAAEDGTSRNRTTMTTTVELEEDDAAAAAGCLVFRGCHLPPGFRFQPTDQEIIVYYLKKKITATAAFVTSIIADVDIYKFDPWDLPDKAAMLCDGEWFFFSPRDRKYPNGARPNRTAGSGYWKATGTDKPILASGGAHCLGVKKALVFYQGRSPKGTKTEWVMHEYRLLDTDNNIIRRQSTNHDNSMRLDDWVLCRVRSKASSGGGGLRLGTPLGVGVGVGNNDSTTAAAAAAPSISRGDELLVDEEVPYPYMTTTMTTTTAAFHQQQPLFADIDHGGGPGGDDTTTDNAPHPPPHHTAALVSVQESIKRNLSFQAIDELYLLQPPNKRANSFLLRSGAHDNDQHLSPTSSFSISETHKEDDFF